MKLYDNDCACSWYWCVHVFPTGISKRMMALEGFFHLFDLQNACLFNFFCDQIGLAHTEAL